MRIFIFFIFFSTLFSAQYSISSAERSALVSIYQTTNGENWSQTWDLNKDPKNWYGIKIKNHKVAAINLCGNALSGNFPSNLSVFTNLESLDFSNNNLKGDISASISGLNNLKSLSINDNFLTGDPSSTIASLSGLMELSLGHNLFVINDVNSLLQNFPLLKILDISSLNLSEVPQNISSLTQLEVLNLSDNQLKNGFGNLSSLSKLKELKLSGNQFSTIPSEIGNLSQLITLDLSRNFLAKNLEMPLSNLKNLEWLSLENNLLENLPNNIGSLTNLIQINLGRNLLSGNFSALLSLKKLQQLLLDHNLIKGDIPSEFFQLTDLQLLSLIGNNLSGNIPSKIPALTFIDDNRFTLADIKNFLDQKPSFTDFTFSPQRYDETISLGAALGENITLKQSLSGNDYQFTWYKNLDEKQNVSNENFYINDLKPEDYTSYTCEAFFAKDYPDYFLELSFFREPIKINSTLAVKETDKNLSIYPNPTSDILFIRAVNEKVETVSIFDMSGKTIFTDSSSAKLRINVRPFPTGAYLILVKTPTGNKTFKFIKK